MKHKNISIIFISLLIIAILLMMSPNMLAYTIPAVENLKVEYTDGTAYLSWSSVANADGYEVFVNIPGYGYANIGSVSDNKVSVIGISEDTAYSVKVRAYEYVNNIRETGSFSNEVDFDTNKEADLDRVTGVKVETTENIANVSWNSVSGADGYEVYLDIPNYGYLKIGNVTTNSAILMGFPTNGKYAVKIRAYKGTNGEDGYGEFSSSKTFNIDNEDLDDDKKVELDQVRNLTYDLDKDKVYLDWSNVTDADEYIVYISINGGSYSEIGRVTGSEAIINDLRENTTYKVKIAAYNKHDDVYGEESKVITFKTDKEFEEKIEIDKVRNLTVDVDGNKVYLDWSNVADADEYEVYLSKNSGAYSLVGTVENSNATISELDYDTSYKVKVRAYNEKYDEYGTYSDIKSFKTEEDEDKIEIGKVRNLSVDVDGNKVYLDWSNVADADEYEVYLSKNSGAYSLIGTVTNSNATISELDYDTSYKVKVRAYNEKYDEYGTYSDIKSFKTEEDEDKIEIGKVRNLSVDVDGNKVYLDWSNVADADEYEVYLSKNSGAYKLVGTVANSNATISQLDYNTSYKVKVRAYNERYDEYGTYSDIESFKTEKRYNDDDEDDYTSTTVGTVRALSLEVQNRNEVALEWSAVSGADGYEVYLSEDGGSYKHVLTTKYVKEIITDLEYNTSYRVKVRAYKEVNGREKYGSYSSAKSFKTERYSSSINNEDVGKVTNVKATVTGSTVYLSWKSVPGAVKYEILFTVPGYGGATSIWSEGPGRTISGLTTKDSNYTARVRAYKYVDGRLVPGEYSDVVRFHGE